MKCEICVIGSLVFLTPFLQFGLATYNPPSTEALREFLESIESQKIGIVFIEDSLCAGVKDILDRYRSSLTPIFIPLGESADGHSFSRQMIRDLMEKAVGVNVL
ncbi:MAG: hypothetical protein FWE76_04140 [Symbiobacteriaceae bacterium]|nr:hypothetical protein [Symbiobacteriaceae bacterium]